MTSGRPGMKMNNNQSTIGRNIYGQCLFIGWAAMVVHLISGKHTVCYSYSMSHTIWQIHLGALLVCSSCGNGSVGTNSYYGGNTMQNRLVAGGASAPISNEFQMPRKQNFNSEPRDYI